MKHSSLLTIFILCTFVSFSQWVHQDEMTVGELYSFDVGDVFETRFYSRSYVPCDDFSRVTIYSKEVFPDKLVYQVEVQRLVGHIVSEDGWHQTCKYTHTVDSVENVYTSLNESMYAVAPDANIDSVISSQFGNDTAYAIDHLEPSSLVYDIAQLIPDTLKIYGCGFWEFESYWSNYYIQGLGGIQGGFSGLEYGDAWSLNYFKKSYGTYGTPYLFTTGTDDLESKISNLSIFPNPAKEQFSFEDLAFSQPYEYQIFNLHGELVQQGVILSERGEVQLHNLSSGVYLIRTEHDSEPIKFIIQ